MKGTLLYFWDVGGSLHSNPRLEKPACAVESRQPSSLASPCSPSTSQAHPSSDLSSHTQ